MIWILVYIISAIFIYNFAYYYIRKIDKKEREKLHKWEYSTLGEVRKLLNDIYSDLDDTMTLGALESYIDSKAKELEKE